MPNGGTILRALIAMGHRESVTHVLVAESDISPSKRHKHPRQHCSNQGKTKQEQAVSLPYDAVNASRMPDLGQSGMHAQQCRACGCQMAGPKFLY